MCRNRMLGSAELGGVSGTMRISALPGQHSQGYNSPGDSRSPATEVSRFPHSAAFQRPRREALLSSSPDGLE